MLEGAWDGFKESDDYKDVVEVMNQVDEELAGLVDAAMESVAD